MAEDPELEDLLVSVEAGANQINKDDAELSQLLDSALKDFAPSRGGESGPINAATGVTSSAAESNVHVPSTASNDDFPHLEDLLKGFASFGSENATSSQPQPQEMEFLKELMKEDPQMLSQFEQLAQAACQVDETESSQKQFSESLTSTMTALTQNMESLQSNLSEEEMMAALAGLNLANPRSVDEGELKDDISLDGDDDVDAEAAAAAPSPAFLPMLGGMMKSILSKEVLHPSLQEIANIYPGWLEENKETLSDEDYVRFEKQYIIISEVCRDFEEETESSSEDDKQRRFERVLRHMQNMHELGQPPKELLLKLDPTMETNPGGVPLMPRTDQCNIM